MLSNFKMLLLKGYFFVSFQSKRLGALNKFKSKDRSILIATDVASRGLDIPHVDVVINFDIPTHSKVNIISNNAAIQPEVLSLNICSEPCKLKHFLFVCQS